MTLKVHHYFTDTLYSLAGGSAALSQDTGGYQSYIWTLFATFLSFEFSVGGGYHPPPGRAKVAQTPGRAQVKRIDEVGGIRAFPAHVDQVSITMQNRNNVN